MFEGEVLDGGIQSDSERSDIGRYQADRLWPSNLIGLRVDEFLGKMQIAFEFLIPIDENLHLLKQDYTSTHNIPSDYMLFRVIVFDFDALRHS